MYQRPLNKVIHTKNPASKRQKVKLFSHMYFFLYHSVNAVIKENLCKKLTVLPEIVNNKTLVRSGFDEVIRSAHECFKMVLKVSCVRRVKRYFSTNGPRRRFLALLFYTSGADIGYN